MNSVALPSTAVVLAAGLGSRFGARGRERPKGFIEFGDEPIIERSIRNLIAAGISRVVLVTGHLSEFYESLAVRRKGIVELVHNPRYAESGSMYSLYVARNIVEDDFLLLESDLLYERAALTHLAASPEPAVMLMSGPTGSGDEVYVQADDGKLRRLSKKIDQFDTAPSGELVGISRISRSCYRAMNQYAESAFTQTLKVEYEQALVAAAEEVPVECLLIPDLAWSEIDNDEHWQRVHEKVFPRIVKRDAHFSGSVS